MYLLNFIIISIFTIIINLLMKSLNGFNLSPKPNLIFKEPNLRTYIPKYRSSYFGFTIVLRENSFVVGAPRAQSSLELQRKINETGAIYKCSIKSQQCIPYVFDSLGNIVAENNEYTYDSEMKDYQWLGAAMDGGPKETDRLVVCAPRLIASLPNDYLMHGICYWVQNTIEDKLLKVKKISPLRLKADQVREINNFKYFYYMFGEQGISVHITENNEEIIIGAPGIHTWKGSIIRYSAKMKEDVGGLSRRESNQNKIQSEQQYASSLQRLRKRDTIEYISEVPNPETWDQPNDSYFGYSVSSGFFELQYNKKQILYVASAPQANKQSGEVYLFDIIKTSQGYHSIKKYYTFHGNQFGEYFGYAVLAEDLNNDGLTDIVVSAPLYSIDKYHEKGAIYVFMNKGKMNFENGKVITTKTDTPDRFGTTITKLGDINHDGYNDIAVGAPFEGNGAVYIFLGNVDGLRDKPSQVLKYPSTSIKTDKFVPAMFGHGLSKGVDIDFNGFNDFAIGAPNSEIVYLYKSYPVITIDASVKALSREIQIHQTKLQLNVCYRIESTTKKINQQEIVIKLKADIIQKRVQFVNPKTNEMTFIVNAKETQECRLIDATVKFNVAAVFKPIEIEMQYKLKNEIFKNDNTTEIEEFCETCAVVDPLNSALSIEKISFSTGCKDECVANMKIKSSGLSPSFVIGSSRTITVNYEITNHGENAYLPQINVTSSNRMPFARIPSNCEQNDYTMICDLYNKQPMLAGDKDLITIAFDASNIEGDSILIQAEVFSTGKESNPDDNTVLDLIELKELSDVEITGHPNPLTVNLEDNSGIIEVINTYEIRNHGPSKIKEMNVSIFIPISYITPNSNIRTSIIDFNSINVNAIYYEKHLKTDFYQNNVILLKDPIEISSTPVSIIENLHKIETAFDMSFMDDNNNNYINNEQLLSGSKMNNLQTISNDEYINLPIMTRRKRNVMNNINLNSNEINQKSLSNFDLDFMNTLPINKTILFNCMITENTQCVKAITNVYDFDTNNENILNITIKFNIDLNEINKILLEPLEFFVITTDLQVTKDENGKSDESLKITKTIAHNIFSKHQIYSTPIWVYILSILGGILLLTAITYVLYKYGFFRRQKKEELQKLHRESRIQAEDTEDEG